MKYILFLSLLRCTLLWTMTDIPAHATQPLIAPSWTRSPCLTTLPWTMSNPPGLMDVDVDVDTGTVDVNAVATMGAVDVDAVAAMGAMDAVDAVDGYSFTHSQQKPQPCALHCAMDVEA